MAKTFQLLGAPFDLGSRTRGTSGAPDALRQHGLSALVRHTAGQARSLVDLGDVPAPEEDGPSANPRNLGRLVAYSDVLMSRLAEIYSDGGCPVVIGGDHSVSMPTVTAAAAHLRATMGDDARLGLVYVDAHPDLETLETTPSGDLHGMSVAALIGQGDPRLVELGGFTPKVRPEDVALIGLRDVMASERELIEKLGMPAYSATDIDRLGLGTICERVFTHMAEKTSGFVLSFDIDALDPSVAPGVEYPEPGGLSFREARTIAEFAAEADGLLCLEVVEVNTELDRDDMTVRAAATLVRSVVRGRPVAA